MYVLQQKKMAAFDRYFDQLKDKANLEDLISEHLK